MITRWQQAREERKTPVTASWVSDRDEKGEPKAPEKASVPRLAAAATAKAAKKPVKPAAVEPAVPVAPPTATSGGKVNPIDYIPTEALIKIIGDMPKEEDFAQNKNKQEALIQLTNILKVRPVLAPEPVAPKGQAPAAPVVASKKAGEPFGGKQAPPFGKKDDSDSEDKTAAPIGEDPTRAKVPLGGLTVASAEDEPESKEAAGGIEPEGGFKSITNEYDNHPLIEMLWDSLKRVPGQPDRRQLGGGWGTKTKQGLVLSIKGVVTLGAPKGETDKEADATQQQPDAKKAPQKPEDKDKWYGYKHDGTTSWDDKQASNGSSWSSQDEDTGTIVEDGGRTPEIGEAHSKREDNTGIKLPATTLPSKLGTGEMATSRALKEAEKLGESLKHLYLDAKSLTQVNDSRPVREAVEAIFRAADMFEDATKTLSKQHLQEEAEEEAAQLKTDNRKKSSFGGLVFAGEEEPQASAAKV